MDVPVWDQWDFVPVLEKLFNGTLTFHDLWAQNNEHRIFFPKIIMLVLARLTGWNTAYERAMSIVFGVGIFAVVAAQIHITMKATGEMRLIRAIPVTALLIFSLKQWMNWMWGWQMQILLCVFAVTAGIVLIANTPFKWHRYAAAIIAGIVATYSFAGGLCYWIVGLFVLLFIRPSGKKEWMFSVLMWIAVSCAVFFFYFYDFHKPENQTSLLFMFTHPAEYINYFFSYLGLPLTHKTRKEAFVLGLLGAAFSCYVTWFVVRFRGVKFTVLVPYLALCLFSAAGAAVTGVGRAGLRAYSLGYHYVSIAMMFWVYILVFINFLIADDGVSGSSSSENKARRGGSVVSFSFYAVVVFLIVYNYVSGNRYCMEQYDYFLPARNELLLLRDDEMLMRLYPSADVVKKRALILKRYNLSVFRELREFKKNSR